MSERKFNMKKPLGESRFINSFASNRNIRPVSNVNEVAQQNKRPRLDVAFSQTVTINSSTNRQVDKMVNNIKETSVGKQSNAVEDSYWEEIDESEIEECILKASQTLIQEDKEPSKSVPRGSVESDLLMRPIIIKNENSSTRLIKNNEFLPKPEQRSQRNSLSSTAIRNHQQPSRVPLVKAASSGNLEHTISVSSASSSSSPSSSSVQVLSEFRNTSNNKFIPGENHIVQLYAENKKYKEKYKELEEKHQIKVGEVSLLRSHVSKCNSEKYKQKEHYLSVLKKTKEEYELTIRKVQDENVLLQTKLSEAKSDLNFKMMDLKSLDEKLRHSRSLQKTSQWDCGILSREFHTGCTTVPRCSGHLNSAWEQSGKMSGVSAEWISNNMIFSPTILTPTLQFEGQQLFEHCTASLEAGNKASLFDKNDIDDSSGVQANISWFAYSSLLGELFRCHSLTADNAVVHINKLLDLCAESMKEMIKIERTFHVSVADRVREIFWNSHSTVPLSTNYTLHDPNRWYPEEHGIIQRRLLGLVTEIVNISAGVIPIIIPPSLVSSSSDCVHDSHWKQKPGNEKQSLLHVLKDTVEHISDELRSVQFNGVLASAASLVTAILERKPELTDEGQSLLLEIVRNILLSCPGPTVVLLVCKFLLVAGDKYPVITRGICTNKVTRNSQEHYLDRKVCNYFDRDTCIITIICYLIQSIKSDRKIFLVGDVIMQWYFSIKISLNKSEFPEWLRRSPSTYESGSTNRESECECSKQIETQVCCLLKEAVVLYDDDEKELSYEDKRVIESLLSRGITLFYTMQGCSMILFGEMEGHYELFIHTLSICKDKLKLEPAQRWMLEDLCKQEENKGLESTVEDGCDDELEELSLSIFTL